jgi:gliding motility-associated-like protein
MRRISFILSIFFLVLLPVSIYATHNRAGEITYRHIGGYTFEFRITTYTYAPSPANRNELPVSWGDGTSSIVPITSDGHIPIPNTDYYFNTYIANHTYPGPGVYEILMEDPNRNQGVNNIPNSVNVIFSIKTVMLVSDNVGSNNTPVLLNPPIDKAARGHIFIHNPAAFDPDGDSISYAITVCTGANGQPIDGYTLPAATDTLTIDEVRGDLIWNTPVEVGVYNIAILVEEWREHVRIGRIARDMQIDVYETDNNPPVNSHIPDYCIVAGDTLSFNITATDADSDPMVQHMGGGPFEIQSPATFEVDSSGYGWIASHFEWVTNCSHARKQPYTVVLKTEDVNDDIVLVDITSFTINVLHRAPENLQVFPGVDTIRLEWEPTTCGNATGYKIYRRLGGYDYIPDSCETGVPAYTGYQLIDFVLGGSARSYTDDNLGEGLVPGYDYCYRITAFYADGAESISSTEVCTTLVAGTPPILRVSVENDGETDGVIDLAWAVPLELDTLIYDGPYRYEIRRMRPGETGFTNIATVPSVDLRDTTYTDSGINTLIYPYTYSVVLFEEENSEWREVPGAETATSQYIDIQGTDNTLILNMKKRTPWLNTEYEIFRQNLNNIIFESIGTTNESVFTDTGLKNGQEYTYRSIGDGVRPLFETQYFTQNKSHLAKGIPIDTIPPCAPDLYVQSECDSTISYCNNSDAFNTLSWTSPEDSCGDDDVIAFIIYSRDSLYGPFVAIDTVENNVFSYIDCPEGTIEKCYAVTAIDSFYNESELLPFCVYNLCGIYELPNVFTPNADGINDIYLSWNLNNYVKQVNMKIYNRYGKQLFTTEDPDIKWDGRNQDNGKLVSSGVYYYICDVHEPRITGTVLRTLTGFIHVYAGEDNVKAE